MGSGGHNYHWWRRRRPMGALLVLESSNLSTVTFKCSSVGGPPYETAVTSNVACDRCFTGGHRTFQHLNPCRVTRSDSSAFCDTLHMRRYRYRSIPNAHNLKPSASGLKLPLPAASCCRVPAAPMRAMAHSDLHWSLGSAPPPAAPCPHRKCNAQPLSRTAPRPTSHILARARTRAARRTAPAVDAYDGGDKGRAAACAATPPSSLRWTGARCDRCALAVSTARARVPPRFREQASTALYEGRERRGALRAAVRPRRSAISVARGDCGRSRVAGPEAARSCGRLRRPHGPEARPLRRRRERGRYHRGDPAAGAPRRRGQRRQV